MGAFVSSGGEVVVGAGGTLLGAHVGSDTSYGSPTVLGGTVIVSSGGTTNGDELASGSREIISSGGHAQYISLLGGTLEVASGGLADYVEFDAISSYAQYNVSGGSMLVLDAATSFQGLVAGFGNNGDPDKIDLADIAFGTVTSKKGPLSYNGNLLSGTLTVTDGVHTANIALIGQYMASEFAVSNDGHGGTLITFMSATSTTGGHGHGNAIASPVTS